MGIATVNPSTGETIKSFSPLNSEEIESKLNLAQSAFIAYRQTSMEQRSQYLMRVADILEQNSQKYAEIMTLEMGKNLKSAIAEVNKCALVCRFYGENASDFLKNIKIASDATESYITYQPLGVILAVMPWNFPFWQVFRFAAPALMAGNVGLLKHASNVPQCALAIEQIFKLAGLPQGVFQTLLIGADQVPKLMADDRIKAGTLTGSEPAGASFASVAGQNIKKVVLELGGSDPFIVCEDAELDEAVNVAVTARLLNNGQSCIAAKRFILLEAIADQFEEKLKAKFEALKVGDPFKNDTDIGPLATRSILQDIDQQVQKSVEMGAKIVTGGQILESSGNFYPPTILKDIPLNSPAYKEEFFAPVALLFRVKNIDCAINLANDTSLGLGASVWTKDQLKIERFIQEIEAGAVFINGMVKSDPRLPFGGIKHSGFGRELGIEGIKEFVNIKTIWIK